MVTSHRATFVSNIANLHLSSDYSDLKIVCEHDDERSEFPVHRAIVCSQSAVLAREVNSSFKEGKSGIIIHKEFDANTVGRMVQYLYTQDYDAPMSHQPNRKETERDPIAEEMAAEQRMAETNEELQRSFLEIDDADVEPGTSSPVLATATETASTDVADELPKDLGDVNYALLAHVKVHAIASYYDIPTLRGKAAEKFERTLTSWPWEKNAFPELLVEVYKLPKTQDAGLREAVVSVARGQIRSLSSSKTFIKAVDESNCLGEFCAKIMDVIDSDCHSASKLEHEVKRELNKKIDKLEEEIRRVVNADAEEKTAREIAEKAFKTIQSILSRLRECRNERCEAQINVTLDRAGKHGQGDWLVKCRRCGAKHTA